MILPPRTLFVRLVFWIVVFGWAVWKMQDMGETAITGVSLLDTPEVDTVLLPSRTPAAPTGDAPDIVDPAAALSAMEQALTAAGPCGVRGRLVVTLGAAGLEHADIRGVAIGADRQVEVATRCVADAVWGAPWPRTKQGFELERGL